jgi:hypothetical protein
MDTPEEQEAKARRKRRKLPLYTMDLTPMFEVSDETWEVVGPILFPEQTTKLPHSEIYPWLYRLDETRREEFIDYCVELDCWHEELEFAAYDLETATEFSYSSDLYEERAPHLRRLALIYHLDNVDHRIYAYREKVFQMIGLFVGGVAAQTKFEDFKKSVRDTLSNQGLGRVVTLLNRLEDRGRTPDVASALTRRKRLVHGLAVRRWKSLKARSRIEEFVTAVNPVEAVEQIANLEALIKEGRQEIEQVCGTLATFREELVVALKAARRF